MVHMRMGQQDRDAVVIEFRRPVRNVAGVGAGVNDIERPAVVRPDQVTVGFKQSGRDCGDLHGLTPCCCLRMIRDEESFESSLWSSTSLP